MNVTNEQALSMLVSALDNDRTSDITTVLEQWRSEMERLDTSIAEQRASQLPPQRYGIIHGTHEQASSDSSHQFYDFVPDAKYVVERGDIAEFAHAHGLSLDRLLSVLDGHMPEYDGYRSMWFQGSLSKTYTPPKERMSPKEAQQFNAPMPAPKPVYTTRPEPQAEFWKPSKKAE